MKNKTQDTATNSAAKLLTFLKSIKKYLNTKTNAKYKNGTMVRPITYTVFVSLTDSA